MRDVAAEVARYLAEPGTYSGSAGSDGRLHEPIVRVIGKRLIDAGHRVANELRFDGARVDLAICTGDRVQAIIEVKTNRAELGIGQLLRYRDATQARQLILVCPSAHATGDLLRLAAEARVEVWPLNICEIKAAMTEREIGWYKPERALREEILDLLGEGEQLRAVEIARGVQARTADVLGVVKNDPLVAVSVKHRGRRREKLYRLLPNAPQSTGTRPRGTHCDRVLDLLADGRWHSHLELYQLGTVAHSRVADLRRRGHRIDCRRDCDLYLYRLVTVRGEGGAVPEPAGVPVAPRRPGLAARRGPDAAPSPGPAQLEIAVA